MASDHKNVLLLIADDLGRYLSCYGCTSLSTPNLDRLAASGTKFEMAFASTASCSGSRSTIYTGLHTHENGQYGLNMTKTHFQTWPHIHTMPKLFNDAGYQTGIIGKVHVGTDDVYPWQVREESGTRDVAWAAERCDAFFEKAREDRKPFHLTVGFVDPHRDVLTRGEFGNHVEQHGDRVTGVEVRPEDVEIPSWISDLPETRREFAEYYQAISRVDTGVGLILDALETRGLSDSTLVIFTSDNGPPFVNSKTTLYDSGIHLPLIVRQPHAPQNISNPNMISFLDLLPTMLDFCDLSPTPTTSPPRLGRSILPIISSPTLLPETQWPHHIFGSHTFHELQNYYPTRILRTQTLKYHRNIAWRLDFPFAGDLYASLSFDAIRNQPSCHPANPVMIGTRKLKDYIFRGPEELYDLDNDPGELVDLAGKDEWASVLGKLRGRMEAWQKKTLDLWLWRDGQSVTNLSRYKADGLEVPERLDFDVEEPGTRGMAMTGLLTEGPAFSGGAENRR